jgi:hypothetical protein
MDSPFIVHFHSDDFLFHLDESFFGFMCQVHLIVNSTVAR